MHLSKSTLICNWLIENMAIFRKRHFSPYGEPPEAILSGGSFLLISSIWFLYFSESTKKNCNRLIYYLNIFGNFFAKWGAPRGAFLHLFCTYAKLCFDCLPYFFYCFDVRNIWAKFYAFVTICAIVVPMSPTNIFSYNNFENKGKCYFMW